ncbi:hypothetical protein GQX74_011888 [Glossina fuscipes]|nr:hypothetical protein GQX74_011888 [Glossina fuscipes]
MSDEICLAKLIGDNLTKPTGWDISLCCLSAAETLTILTLGAYVLQCKTDDKTGSPEEELLGRSRVTPSYNLLMTFAKKESRIKSVKTHTASYGYLTFRSSSFVRYDYLPSASFRGTAPRSSSLVCVLLCSVLPMFEPIRPPVLLATTPEPLPMLAPMPPPPLLLLPVLNAAATTAAAVLWAAATAAAAAFALTDGGNMGLQGECELPEALDEANCTPDDEYKS